MKIQHIIYTSKNIFHQCQNQEKNTTIWRGRNSAINMKYDQIQEYALINKTK